MSGTRTMLKAICMLSVLMASSAHAQFAVIDVGAIAQLIQQVQTMREQLTTARNQLSEAQATLQSMRGGRGMEQLLSGTVRNYLPQDWAALEAVLRQNGGSFAGLSTQLQSLMLANAVLSPARLASMSPADRQQVEDARRAAALLQVITREALSSSSSRFAAIQQLINAIPAAGDQKAILDLQARIGAEQGMLQNEQTKLEVLFQTTVAERQARSQRVREQAIAGIGAFRDLPPMGL